MFISAVSTKGAEAVKPDDEATGNSIGDLTPATFRAEFDEPIRIKNADIELVACKVQKKNEIQINGGNNTLTVRMGDSAVGEQYIAKIPTGEYTNETLATAMQVALQEVMPVNIYKNWTGSVLPTGEIKLNYATSSLPPASNFQNRGKDPTYSIENPIEFTKSDDGDYIKYECLDSQKDQNRSLLRIPSNEWEYCGSIDSGSHADTTGKGGPDGLTRIAVDEFGVWETMKGEYSAILRPVNSIVKSTFDAGFNGFGGATGKPTYFTFEFSNNFDEDGNLVNGLYKYGGMFNENVLNTNLPRSYHPLHHKQINGVLNLTTARPNTRGSPYNVGKQMIFPYCRAREVQGSASYTRKIYYDSGWDGTIQFRKVVGRPGAGGVPQVPESYSFQMDDVAVGGNHKANCLAKRVGFLTDAVRIRPSHTPLIAGLPQQQVANGPIVDTFCAVVNPIVVNPVLIRYRVGSVGKFNNKKYGVGFFPNTIQGLDAGGGPGGVDIYKLPYYKIISVNPDGSPNRVVLTDGGEHIVPFNNATPDDIINTSLFMNDPRTWEFKAPNNDAEETIMENQIFRVTPALADIGVNDALEQDTEYRYSSFNMGLMRDDIFQQVKQPLPATPYGQYPQKLSVPKDLEIDVYSKLFTSGNVAVPAAGQIEVVCHQLQPSTDKDDNNVILNSRTDVRKLLFQASSGTWSGSAGTGPAMANWTTFVGCNNANGAVKITFSIRDTYNIQLGIAHCLNYVNTTSAFIQTVLLTQTNILRGGAGGVVKNVCTNKTRFFPLHPVASILPTTIKEKNIARLKCVGTNYPKRNTFYAIDGRSNMVCNYEANKAFMAKGEYNAPQNIFPDPEPPGGKPVIMIKSTKLIPSQISPGPAPPPAGSTGLCVLEDFSPDDGASLWNAGLHSVMYAQISSAPGQVDVDFPTNIPPTKQAFLPSFSVEIQNLPLSGYIGKGFDEGKLADRRGMGSRLPIAGIVPATEYPDSQDPTIIYHYKTPYPQPVSIRLPTQQFFYNLDINLRNLITGRLLQDLLHSSEVILRIYHLPD